MNASERRPRVADVSTPVHHPQPVRDAAMNGLESGDPSVPKVSLDGIAYEFPDCRSVYIPRDEIADYDGRYEFWDADTESALMVRSPTSPYHERPSMRLARMTDRIAATWGSGIEVLGTSDLLLRDAEGNRHRVLQADQIVYVRPVSKRPIGHAVEVEAGELPDVVLEVDLTTDVRRGKLGLYESWGFPEVWVEVPDKRSPSRPNRKSGLTIYLLGADGYQQAASSAAFPTWSAAEIHTGMNELWTPELPMSTATAAVLRRVGRIMREATGTGPDDDPFLRAERAESEAAGLAAGHSKGLLQGRVEGRAAGRLEILQEVLLGIFRMRGLTTSPEFGGVVESRADLPAATLLQAAYECRDEDDFSRRIGLRGSAPTTLQQPSPTRPR